MASEAERLSRKFGLLMTAVRDVTEVTEHLHDSSEKIEALFKKDIETRAKKFDKQNDDLDKKMKRTGNLDVTAIDDIFDSMEANERRS